MSMVYSPRAGRSKYTDFAMAGTIGGGKPIPAISGPLASNLTVSGLDAATFTRSTTKVFTDYESVLRTAAIDEPVFEGGRRVENLCLQSEAMATSPWTQTDISTDANSIVAPDGATTADTMTATADNATRVQTFTRASAPFVFSIYLKRKTGTGAISLSLDGGSTYTVVAVTSEWQRFYLNQTLANPSVVIKIAVNGDAVYAWGAQLQDITGSAYTQPSEYVSTAGAAASRWFTTKPDGSPIYPAPKLMMEGQSTNYFLQSNTPASHTSPTCPAGTYTLWLTGTGSVAVAAGTAVGSGWGMATTTAPLVVTITTGGTVAFTVTGTVTIAQFEPLPVKSSYIPTTTAAVTRTADACSWPLSAELQAMLSIDKAWTTSLANQTTAGTNQCNMTDATALFKWSTLDAAPFANSGKMVIMRDASNRLAWGFLGAVSGTTGCLVYKDSARTIPGYVKEASVGVGTTFNVVADCKAEGTVVLDWVPRINKDLEVTTRYLLRSNHDFGRLLYTNGGFVVTYDGTQGGSGRGWTADTMIRLIARFSSERLTKQVSSIDSAVLSNATISAFDGSYGMGTTLELSYTYPFPAKFSGLKFFKRWLTDNELMRLQ